MARKTRRSKAFLPLVIILIILILVIVILSISQCQSRTARSNQREVSQHETTSPFKDSITANKTQSIKQDHDIENEIRVTHHGNIEMPECSPNDSLIYNRQGRYSLQYSPWICSAIWVAYKLTASDTQGNAGRSGSFKSDAVLEKRGFRVATNNDYKNSGYDKGHLLPSADRQSSVEANRATFVLSNCSPQLPALNRGTWKKLEESTRRLCRVYDTIYIVVGIITEPLDSELQTVNATKRRANSQVNSAESPVTIGRNNVTVPRFCFKATLARRGDSYTMAAYIMPNSDAITSDVEQYRVSISTLESITGLNLFPSIK